MTAPKLVAAVRTGDRRTALVALRDQLARAIASSDSGRDIAALSKRLMEVMTDLEALPDPAQTAQNPAEMARKRVRNRGSGGD